MTLENILDILEILKAAYPRFYQNQNEEEIAKVAVLWLEMLGDLSQERVFKAVKRTIATQKFPPTIADIREESIADIKLRSPEDVLSEINVAIPKYGRYREREAINNLSPEAQKLVEAIGGWQYLCNSETQMADRSHMIKIYESLKVRNEKELKIPLTFRSELESINGYTELLKGATL